MRLKPLAALLLVALVGCGQIAPNPPGPWPYPDPFAPSPWWPFPPYPGPRPRPHPEPRSEPIPHPEPHPAPRPHPEPTTDHRIREAINRERIARNLPSLASHPALVRAADRHAADMAARDKLDHFGSDGSNWAERCRDAGYPGATLQTIDEDIAGWQTSPEMAVSDWMQSPGHRAAILGRWEHCGAASGTARSGRSYWCVDFGRTKTSQ